jgi:hypothetical protein
MRWCTVENIHMDRVASFWLIRRYVDPGAEFLLVHRETRPDEVRAEAVPVGIPGAELGPHDKAGTCFAKIVRAYQVDGPRVAEVDRVIASALRYMLHAQVPEPCDWYGQLGVGLAAIPDGMRIACDGDRDPRRECARVRRTARSPED